MPNNKLFECLLSSASVDMHIYLVASSFSKAEEMCYDMLSIEQKDSLSLKSIKLIK